MYLRETASVASQMYTKVTYSFYAPRADYQGQSVLSINIIFYCLKISSYPGLFCFDVAREARLEGLIGIVTYVD